MGQLDRLLRPRSVAVIGGGVWCASVIAQCRRQGFAGDLWSVHPGRSSFGGLKTFPSVDDLPAAPDACYVGVNRAATVEVVAALARRGAGGAICFASGFSEALAELSDGADLQAALLAAAGDMPILGPNCYGLLNYLDNTALWPDQHGGQAVTSGVAIVMQSSNIAINLTMQARGLPLAYVVTAGNQAQTGMSAIGVELLEDPRVTALGLHIEGIDDMRALEVLAGKARELGKPIVALKVGASDQAQAATISHTASLAGSDAGARALFARLGIGRATSLAGFIEALKLLHVTGPLRSDRIAAAACSGGEASLVADSVVDRGLSFPALTDAQKTTLRAALGPRVALANPLDYHTYIWGDVHAMSRTFAALAQGDVAMVCVLLDFPRADRCDPAAWHPTLSAIARATEESGTPMAVVSSLPETMPEHVARDLIARRITPLCGLAEAVEALSIAADLGRPVAPEGPVLQPVADIPGTTLTEAEAKAALAAFGLRIPQSARAISPAEAATQATRIGLPVVLKGCGIAHKTEAGAVALDLRSPEAVQQAACTMPTRTFLVEQMIPDAVAELLVGVVRDPAHGYVLTLAAGGQLTELLEDRQSLLVPASRDAVRAALTRLRIWPVLQGYRGRPGAPVDKVLDAVMAVQNHVTATHPAEVEVNPLICTPGAAIAADALIRTGEDPDDG